MKKYFLCMVALLSLAIVACESDDTAPAPAVRPTFDLIDAQPDVTSAVVAANIESKGEAPISEVGFSYQEAGGEYVDVVCTNFKDGLARQTLTGLKPDTEYRWYCYAVLGGERFNASLSKTFRTSKRGRCLRLRRPSSASLRLPRCRLRAHCSRALIYTPVMRPILPKPVSDTSLRHRPKRDILW